MLNAVWRWLVWGMFVVLQTMTPFVHAHATPGQAHSGPAGFLHLHGVMPAEQAQVDAPHAPVLDVADGVCPRAQAEVPVPPILPAVVWGRAPVLLLHAAHPDARPLLPDRHFDRLPPALAPPAA